MHGEIPGSTPRKGSKTYSFQNPKPYVPESDKSEELQTTSQTLTELSETPSQMTSLTNPFELELGKATLSASSTVKKKLKTPTPFLGKKEDLQKFLQEVKIYLLVNADAYLTDLDKILFVLSYMSKGDAASWKEEFFDTAEQKASQNNMTLMLGTYPKLITLIKKDFSPYDVPKNAIYEMKEMKMGNSSIEEHDAKFKMLVTKSKLAKNEAVIEYFWETFPIPLQKNILMLQDPPTTLNKWYKWAIRLQNNFLRMKGAITKTWGTHLSSNDKKPKEKGPRKFYFDPGPKDLNVMDVDVMLTKERAELMKKGLCFCCKKLGHLSQNCPDKVLRSPPLQFPKKMKGKELHAHVRSLLAQMEENDVNEFLNDAKWEGFKEENCIDVSVSCSRYLFCNNRYNLVK